jgi:hypothetical protein
MSRNITDFNARIIPITDIKNDMIESCITSWLLFFEDKISKFYKRDNSKLAYVDYIKFCKDETYLPFSDTKFGLKLKSVVDIHKTSQNDKTIRYYKIKDDIKARYDFEDKESELNDDDVEYI